MNGLGQAPGFFGKLPSHGDFIGRRLPPAVRDCFDNWLQAGLVQSKLDLGEAWLPTWLTSPMWRFVVGAGVCSEQAWAGVMMPSHDRVGRCFPLLLAAGIDGTPSLLECLERYEGWFARLEELALSALDDKGFSLEAFNAALLSVEGEPRGGKPTSYGGPAPASATGRVAGLSPQEPSALAGSLQDGQSAWWCAGSPLVTSCLAVCGSMPASAAYSALLDGRWTDHGWHRVPQNDATLITEVSSVATHNGGPNAI